MQVAHTVLLFVSKMRIVSTCPSIILFLFHFCVNGLDVTTVKSGFLDRTDVHSYNVSDISSHAASNQIVNGNLANKKRYPYFTALFFNVSFIDDIAYFNCGGSLIQNDVVVTASMFIVVQQQELTCSIRQYNQHYQTMTAIHYIVKSTLTQSCSSLCLRSHSSANASCCQFY